MTETLVKRDWVYVTDDTYWIRSLVIGILLAVVGLAIFMAKVHANRRLKRGQPPLPYHAWLVSKRNRRTPYPQPQPNYQFYTSHFEQELPPYSGQEPPVYEPPKAHVYPQSTGNSRHFQDPSSRV